MNTHTNSLLIRAACLCMIFITTDGCKKASDDEVWVETHDIVIMAYKSDPVDGKQFLDVIYENVGQETYRKVKYQLIRRTGTKIDTSERIILPETVFRPKDKRLVPRHIGQSPATFDDVKAGKVWAIVDSKN